MKDVFQNIFDKRAWGVGESVSGPGSSVEATKQIIQVLPDILNQFQIKSVLDAPCGDFNWMRHISGYIKQYIGVDIVPSIIGRNNIIYQAGHIKFLNLDLTVDPLPKTDLIFCRDCLVHFSYQDIRKAITNFKRSGSTYLLTTTFCRRTVNCDIATGGWRPLNLQIEPFIFPVPKLTILENCMEGNGQFADKSLSLWLLDDIHV